jgi:TusA-related sulfurtransferase
MSTPDEARPELGADRFYDAGDDGCAGPGLKVIRDLLESLRPGQSLEIRTVSDVGRTDLEAWIRLRGHEAVAAGAGPAGDRYLVRRGPDR